MYTFENENFDNDRRRKKLRNYGSTNEAVTMANGTTATYFADSNAALVEVWRLNQLSQQSNKCKLAADDGSAKTTNSKECTGACECPQLLNETLSMIRLSVLKLEQSLEEQKRKQKIRRDWSSLADVAERISLAFFLSAALASLLMFFFHGWY